jgi:hypothetical protein
VDSTSVIDGSPWGADLSPAVVQWFTQANNDTVSSPSVKDGTLTEKDLAPAVTAKLNDTTGQVTDVQADAPYPAEPDPTKILQNLPPERGTGSPIPEGAQSLGKWAPGTAKQQSWAMCPTGKTLLSGGFGVNVDDDRKIRIVTSAPVQITPNNTGGFEIYYSPIPGDAAGSFVPNAWLVEGYNEGTVPTEVRPQMVCAAID